MSIPIIDQLKPLGNFPAVDASDVQAGNKRLSQVLSETPSTAYVDSVVDNKVDKVDGKGLSTNDYTTAEKTKLNGIEAQANKTIISTSVPSTPTDDTVPSMKLVDDTYANITDLEYLSNYVTPQMFGAKSDGVTDDTEAIQAAVDYIYGMGGGIVAFPPERNPMIFTTVVVKANVTLQGIGGILKLKNNHCNDSTVAYYLLHNMYEDNKNVAFKDLVIDGNKANNTQSKVADIITAVGENVVVTGCKITNPPDSGVMFSEAVNAVCDGNWITGAPDCGIYINNNDNVNLNMMSTCNNNKIDNCYTGIAMKRICQQMSIIGNNIKNCNFGITHEHANRVDDFSTDTIISDNMIVGSAGIPIILRGTQNCTVSGNYIKQFSHAAISVQNSNGCTISSNTINAVFANYNIHSAAIQIVGRLEVNEVSSRNTILGNAISIENNDTSAYRMTGIEISGLSDELVSDYNIIEGNVIYGSGTKKITVGVSFTNASNNSVKNNIFKQVTYTYSTNNSKDNVIVDNLSDSVNTQFVYDYPIVSIRPNGTKVYQNVISSAPNFAANTNDIALSKNPVAQGFVGWIYTGSEWKTFGNLNDA